MNLREPFPKIFSLIALKPKLYADYQIEGNIRKFRARCIDDISLPQDFGNALNHVVNLLNSHHSGPIQGVCHGVRSGVENAYIAKHLNPRSVVFGTDISPTVLQVPNGVQLDFHLVNPEWIGKLDFVYCNSIDQSNNPNLAITTWLQSLKPSGELFVHLTPGSGLQGHSRLDPFAVEPELFPYFFLTCPASQSSFIEKSIQVSSKSSRNIIYVIRKKNSLEFDSNQV